MFRRCALTLLLVLFLCDFAMPLSPGAFRFDSDKTIEIVHQSATRATTLGVPLMAAQRPLLSIHRVARQVSPTLRAARIDPAPFGHVFPLQASRAEPEPAPPEDH